MNFEFEKYQGAGNDFIIIDDRKEYFPDKEINLIKNSVIVILESVLMD